MTAKVLIIEDDSQFRLQIAQRLRQESFGVFEAEQKADATELLLSQNFDVVVIGLEGLRREGLSLIQWIKRISPGTRVITINGLKHMDLSIEAMKLGAYDDFLIPFELDSLIASIRSACTKDPFS